MAKIKYHPGIPICPICNELMQSIGNTFIFGMKTGTIYGHQKCQTQMIVILPGKAKFFGKGLIL